MSDGTGIEWTDATYNPIVGCSIVSPGCTNCYAMKMAARLEKMLPATRPGGQLPNHYTALTKTVNGNPVWTGRVTIAPDHILTTPLRWKKPRKIFVNSMGDLFHESVPDAWIDKVFAVMALCPQHTFQILSKRSKRMREYMTSATIRSPGFREIAVSIDVRFAYRPDEQCCWPLPNVWLGVSAEDQARADERIPDLLTTPAAVRFVSAEPLLSAVDFTSIKVGGADSLYRANALTGDGFDGQRLSWVIAGGESGPGARVWPGFEDACHSIRDQCRAAGVAFFMKQMAGTVKSKMPPIPGNLMIREFPK